MFSKSIIYPIFVAFLAHVLFNYSNDKPHKLANNDLDPLVSVIIPSFKVNPAWFNETLASLAKQTLKNFEVLIIDDADPSFKVNASFPVRIIHHKRNQGLACARNSGALNAIAPFIIFLDPDDVLDSMALEKLLLFGVPLIGSRVPHYDDVIGFVYSGTVHFGDKNDEVFADYNLQRLRKENYLTSTALISRELYMEVGGMCPRSIIHYYEDYDFWLRLSSMGFQGKLLREPLFYYRRHSQGQSKSLVQNIPEALWKKELKDHNPVAFGIFTKSFFCQFLTERAQNSKDFPCYGSVRAKNSYKLFGISFDEASISSKDWCKTNSWIIQHDIDAFFNRIQVEPKVGKVGVLYFIPWMVMGGADLYDLNVLKSLKSDSLHNYHITLVVARHIQYHPWQHHFHSLSDEIFHLQRMTNNSNVEDQIIDYIVRSRNVTIVINSKTISGYRAFRRWETSNNKIYMNLKKLDILHLYEADSRDSWEWRGAQVSWAMEKRVVVSENLKSYFINIIGKGDSILGKRSSFRSLSKTEQDQIHVIYPPLDLELAVHMCEILKKCFSPSYSEPTLLFLGRLDIQKMPHLFIEVAAMIPTSKARIIGDGPLSHKLKITVLSDYIELSRRLTWTGELSHDDIQLELVRGSRSILLMTSIFEGVPIVVLEALGTGTPVVTTICGGIREIIEDSSWDQNFLESSYMTSMNGPIIIRRYRHASLILLDCQSMQIGKDIVMIFTQESNYWFNELDEESFRLSKENSRFQRWKNAEAFRKKFSLPEFYQKWRNIFENFINPS